MTSRNLRAGLPALIAAMLAAVPAFAQDEPKLDTGDTAWMLTSTVLVLAMTIPGLALFYGGMVRKKNVLATVMQSFAVTCLMSVLWFLVAYSIAFDENPSEGLNAYFGGFGKALFGGVNMESLTGTIPEWVFATFQMTFAIITPALILGAIAERMKFSAVLWFTGLWLIFVYAPICHWVWGGGFLGGAGVLDFAGGTVVHINSGIAALVACLILGPRKGYGTTSMAPHNLTFSLIGASLLWVGWFGFNAGSAAAANALAGVAMANTQVATAAAALTWMFAEWIVIKKPSLLGILSGAIAGLVAITPAAGFVAPSGALVIGIVAGVGCYLASVHIKKALKYDDSLDVFGIHGVGGIIGALLTGAFASSMVNAEAAEGASVATQFYGIIATIIYCAIASAIILFIIKAVIGLRPTAAEEEEGLDIVLHGESVQ
ncbi:MAG: ammonium transporter [Bradyrhizobiaceae bacterium]|nr:ammonium transporter [Bradyrhizobiaceae bacterium]